MRIYYFIAVIGALLNMAVFFYRDEEKKTNYYVRLLLLIICLANFGYLALGTSTTLREAILAKKITYFGGCFLPPIMAACMCSLCNIKIKGGVKCGCILYSALVYVMVMTIGFTDFYYKSVSMGNVFDATALVREKGPGYVFFSIILYGYIVVDILITIYAFFKKQVTQKNLYLLITMQVVTITLYLGGRAISPTFEVLPAVYVVNGMIFVIIQEQLSRYNLDDCIYTALQQTNSTGYLVLDRDKKFITCNDIAKDCIPKLSECRVDASITNKKELEFLCEWIQKFKESGNASYVETLQCADRYYECTIKILQNGKKQAGYIFELQDCTDRKNYLDLVSKYNEELKQQVEKQTRHISLIQQKTLLGMANMVENRDNNTGGHIRRTSDVIGIFVQTIKDQALLELSDEFCRDLVKAAPMHDLGKIAIEDRILQKPGRFTDEEFAIMKTHSEKSAQIIEKMLRGVEENHFVDVAVNVARYHHEKWNGAGYPEGLSKEKIPLEARIMAIADVYDALVSKRCYKEAMSFSKANDIILESMGSHFDPGLEQVYTLSRDKLEAYYANDMLAEC